MSQEFKSSFAGWIWLQTSHEAACKIKAKTVQSSKDSTRAGGSLSKMLTYMAIGKRPVSFSGPSHRLLECPYYLSADFLQRKTTMREQGRKCKRLLWPTLRSHTLSLLRYSIRSKLLSPATLKKRIKLHF